MKKTLDKFTVWDELVTNPTNGLLSWKRLSTLICGVVGIGIIVYAAWADQQAGREINLTGAGMLLSYALGTNIWKGIEFLNARKTRDEDGPLTTPASTAASPPKEPELMPQETQPPLPQE